MNHAKSVALIGCGMWGRNIARVLAKLGALKTVCDANAAAIAPLAAELGASFTTRLEEILGAPDVQAVVIATPAATHAEVGTSALAAGKHVYLEKPIALAVRDAEALAALAAAKSRVLMVGHLLRYHPGFMKLMELVRDRALGKIQYVCSNRLNQGRIRTEENALWSLAPHDLSMVLALVGEAPSVVTASGAAIVQSNIVDIATIHLAFPSGAKAQIYCSWLNAYKEHKLTVVGDHAMAVFDDTSREWVGKSLTLFSHTVTWNGSIPNFTKGSGQRVAFEQSEPLKNEIEHFLECMETGASPRTDSREAIPVLDVLERAQRAIEISSI
jgi:UDP-2-acetamido-3-amino-2,3-dideoxy-glucuronate N-acetyltransferase